MGLLILAIKMETLRKLESFWKMGELLGCILKGKRNGFEEIEAHNHGGFKDCWKKRHV